MTVLSRKLLNMCVYVCLSMCVLFCDRMYVCVCVSMAPLREVSVVASHSTACRLWFSCGPPPGPTFGTQRKYTRGTCSHCFLDPSFIGLCVLVYFGCTFVCVCACVIVCHYFVLSGPDILRLFGPTS